MLLFNVNRKARMESQFVRLYLTLVTFKVQCKGHPDFESLYLVKELRETICYY